MREPDAFVVCTPHRSIRAALSDSMAFAVSAATHVVEDRASVGQLSRHRDLAVVFRVGSREGRRAPGFQVERAAARAGRRARRGRRLRETPDPAHGPRTRNARNAAAGSGGPARSTATCHPTCVQESRRRRARFARARRGRRRRRRKHGDSCVPRERVGAIVPSCLHARNAATALVTLGGAPGAGGGEESLAVGDGTASFAIELALRLRADTRARTS